MRSNEKYHLLKEFHDVLQMKVTDLQMLEIHQVTRESILEYLCEKVWRKQTEPLHTHQIVADILSISPARYMNYQSIAFAKNQRGNFSLEEMMKEIQSGK